MVVITSEYAYICDTVFIDGNHKEGEKYGDKLGEELAEWCNCSLDALNPKSPGPSHLMARHEASIAKGQNSPTNPIFC